MTVVEAIEAITASFRSLYHHLPADNMLGGVAHHAGVAIGFLRDPGAGDQRERLAGTAAETAMLAGRLLSMDKGQHDAAFPHYRAALQASAVARSHALHAMVLGHISRLHDHRRELHRALDVLQQATRHAVRSESALVTSWVAAVQARTHATAGNEAASLAALETASFALENSEPEYEPGWLDYFDRCRLFGFAGFCNLRLGRYEDAFNALNQALLLLDPLAVKERACYVADLAGVRIAQGEVPEGARLAGSALDLLAETPYATGVQRVRDLRARQLARWHHEPMVRRLDEQLASMAS